MYIKQIESQKVERLLRVDEKQARHSGPKEINRHIAGREAWGAVPTSIPVTSDQLFPRASCLITSARLISKGSPCHGRPKTSASFDAHLSVLLHLLAHLLQIGLKKVMKFTAFLTHLSKWLITMVIVSPLTGVIPLPKWPFYDF